VLVTAQRVDWRGGRYCLTLQRRGHVIHQRWGTPTE